jgi:hypothetical protein
MSNHGLLHTQLPTSNVRVLRPDHTIVTGIEILARLLSDSLVSMLRSDSRERQLLLERCQHCRVLRPRVKCLAEA